METPFDITIAILTKNSEKTLVQCLNSIFSQENNSSKVEVLVLDNGSTDCTLDIIKTYPVNLKSFPKLNIPQLRNTAARLAKSKIVGYVDSDCVIDKNWISKSIEIFSSRDVSVTGYRYTIPKRSTWLQKNWYINNKSKIRHNQLIPGGNMIVRKSSLFTIRGFDESLETGEDADFLKRARKAGFKIVSDPSFVNLHLGFPENIIDFFKKEMWYGKGIKLGSLLKEFDKPTISSIIFFFFIFIASLSAFFMKLTIALVCTLLALFTCLIAAIHRKYINCVGHGIVAMSFIYCFYFLARISAIVGIIFRVLRKTLYHKIHCWF